MKLEIRISIDAKKLAEAWLASCMCVFLFLTPFLSLRRSFSVEEKWENIREMADKMHTR